MARDVGWRIRCVHRVHRHQRQKNAEIKRAVSTSPRESLSLSCMECPRLPCVLGLQVVYERSRHICCRFSMAHVLEIHGRVVVKRGRVER